MTHRTVPADTARHWLAAFAACQLGAALLVTLLLIFTEGIR